LRLFAGWTSNSTVPQRYINYFGDEASESLLQAYGIIPSSGYENNILKPKQCPNCNEPNKPDARFCTKCKIILKYDAYNEIVEESKEKEHEIDFLRQRDAMNTDAISTLSDRLEQVFKEIEVLKKREH
jgi:hypothetical protein